MVHLTHHVVDNLDMKLTLASVLFIVAVVLFVAAVLVVDGHVNRGNPGVITNLGLACTAAGLAAQRLGK